MIFHIGLLSLLLISYFLGVLWRRKTLTLTLSLQEACTEENHQERPIQHSIASIVAQRPNALSFVGGVLFQTISRVLFDMLCVWGPGEWMWRSVHLGWFWNDSEMILEWFCFDMLGRRIPVKALGKREECLTFRRLTCNSPMKQTGLHKQDKGWYLCI